MIKIIEPINSIKSVKDDKN